MNGPACLSGSLAGGFNVPKAYYYSPDYLKYKQECREKRTSSLSTASQTLKDAGVHFTISSDGYHYMIDLPAKAPRYHRVNFWPTTGKWRTSKNHSQTYVGLGKLMTYLKTHMPDQPTEPTEQGLNIMDKNVAALMRQDTRTVRVSLHPSSISVRHTSSFDPAVSDDESPYSPPGPAAQPALYTYVTHLNLKVGSYVAVIAKNVLSVGRVEKVDDGVEIEPNSTTKYQWVVAEIDVAPYLANQDHNKKLESVVTDAYKANLRKSFAAQVMVGIEDQATKESIQRLLQGPQVIDAQ